MPSLIKGYARHALLIFAHLANCGYSLRKNTVCGNGFSSFLISTWAIVCLPSPASRLPKINTSFSAEIENFRAVLPPFGAGKRLRLFNMACIARRYRPYCIAKQAISEAGMTLFRGQKRPLRGLKRVVSGAGLLHNRAYKAYKSYKTNKLPVAHSYSANLRPAADCFQKTRNLGGGKAGFLTVVNLS